MKVFGKCLFFIMVILSLVHAQILDPLCKTWDSSTGACTSCYNGYIISNGKCVAIPPQPSSSDPNCVLYDANGNCLTCSFKFVLINGYCQPVSDTCKTWDSTGACTSCYPGWNLSNGMCTVSPPQPSSSDPNCVFYDANGNCLRCSFKFVLINGYCQPVSDTCKTWDSTGACTSCYPGWNLSNGICISTPVPIPSDPLCSIFNPDGSCKVCSYRSVLKNGLCVPVDNLCQTWDQITGLCTSCFPGYTLTMGGTCI